VFAWPTERSLRTSLTSERAGTFSGVTGGRAPSFHDLSVGEAPAPLPQEAENGGGGKFPSQISRRKDQPGRLGTQEKAPVFSGCSGPLQTLFNVSNSLRSRKLDQLNVAEADIFVFLFRGAFRILEGGATVGHARHVALELKPNPVALQPALTCVHSAW